MESIVKNALMAAWRDSMESETEEGGWIYMQPGTRQIITEKAGGNVSFMKPREKGDNHIALDVPIIKYGYYIVGNFHTHISCFLDPAYGDICSKPNYSREEGIIDGDLPLSFKYGVPWLVKSVEDINSITVVGPGRRRDFSGPWGYPNDFYNKR
jgi:hypothetical protein